MADSDDGNGPEETPPPRKLFPINQKDIPARRQQQMKDLAVAAAGPVTTLDGHKPSSLEDARDAAARALGEILLQRNSLRRFRRLLRSKNDKIALAAYELAIQHILATLKPGSDSAKPTQIIVNNLVARPPGTDTTTVEVH